MRRGPSLLSTLLAASTACGPGDPSGDTRGSEDSTASSSESGGPIESGTTSDADTETDTGAETETETETGDDPEPVLDGDIPEIPCTITPGPSVDALCEGGPCPLTTDVLVWCDSGGFGMAPVTVAAGNDGPRLLVGSGDIEWLFALHGDGGELVPFPQGAPFGFPRFAQDSAGELFVIGVVEDNWASASWPEGIHRLAPLDAPQWAREFGFSGAYSRAMDGLEVDSEDRLHVWTGLQSEILWLTRDANGVWIEQEDVASVVAGPRTLTIDGEQPVGFRYVATQLNAEIGGEKIPLGTPQGSQSEMIRVARRPKPSWGGIGPDYAVTTTHDTGTQIHWPGGELLVPEAAYMPELPCPPDHDPDVACEPSCSFDLTGVVEEQQQGTRGMLAVARTADGVLWIAWIESHFVLEHTYTQVCPGEPERCECEPEVITDERSSRLRVLRYDFVGEPVEVLSMPFAADYDAPRPKIIADAFADRIVLSLIVEGLGPMQDQRGHRVLELDTDAL